MNKKIIFMGTPDFAAASLAKLIENNFNIIAVVTIPDKQAGRGLKLQESAVKKLALNKNIPILQPEKLKNEEFVSHLKNLNPDLFVVVAFRMLPQIVWEIPKYGTINLHASLLPQYRGAAPINHAIINGEKITGVTTFFINEQIDTGDLIMQEKVEILDNDNAENLHDKLMNVGADILSKTCTKILNDNCDRIPQKNTNEDIKFAPKISKEFCEINWNKKVSAIVNFIKGLSPYPAAWCKIFDSTNTENLFKIYSVCGIEKNHSFEIGKIETDYKKYFRIYCLNGYIEIIDLQIAGKKRMKIDEFLRGNKLIFN